MTKKYSTIIIAIVAPFDWNHKNNLKYPPQVFPYLFFTNYKFRAPKF